MFIKSLNFESPKWFRLLTIVLNDDGPLRLNISDGDCKQSKYCCLSYTWEPNNPSHQIWLNDKEVHIGHNLWLFLTSARSAGLATPLWIDALCINQQHVQERNHVVSRMGDIYANAQRVLVWLGQLKRTTNVFLTDLKNLEKDLIQLGQRRDRRAFVAKKLELLNKQAQSTWERNAAAVLSLPYFSRLWISQELLLADSSSIWLDDTRTLDMDIFAEIMVVILSRNGHEVLDHMTAFPGYKFIWWHYTTGKESRVIQGPIDLTSLLPRFADSKCKVVLDRVYALLSLATNGSNLWIDYGSDATTLFTRTMEFSMDGRPIDSLLLVGANLVELLELLPQDQETDEAMRSPDLSLREVSQPIFYTAVLIDSEGHSEQKWPVACIAIHERTTGNLHLFEYAFDCSSTPPSIVYCRSHEYLNPDAVVSLPTPRPAQRHDKGYYIHTSLPSESLHYFKRSPDAPHLHSWISSTEVYSDLIASLLNPGVISSILVTKARAQPKSRGQQSHPPTLTPSLRSIKTGVVWDAYFQRESSQIFCAARKVIGDEIWTQLRPDEENTNALKSTGKLRQQAPVCSTMPRAMGATASAAMEGNSEEAAICAHMRGASIRVSRDMMRVQRLVCMDKFAEEGALCRPKV